MLIPLYWILHKNSFISTLYPASQSFTTDIKEWDANPVIIYAILAAIGSCVRGKVPLWLEHMVRPSGSLTVNGLSAIFLFSTFAVDRIKWLDVPLSRIAHFCSVSLVNCNSLSNFAAAYWYTVCCSGTFIRVRSKELLYCSNFCLYNYSPSLLVAYISPIRPQLLHLHDRHSVAHCHG